MNHILESLSSLDFQARRQAKDTEKELDAESVNIVNRLFVFFESICRGFDKQYHQQPQSKLNMEKIQWARGFMDAGISRIEMLELGIKKCRLESPINVPTLGVFLKWCTPTPEDLGIPRLDDAYAEACANSNSYSNDKKWSHKAVYHAYTMCNSFELSNLPKKNTFPVFERNYEITVKMLLRGEPLKDIPIGIAYDADYEHRREISKGFKHCNTRETAMAAMEKMLGVKLNGNSNKRRMQENIEPIGIQTWSASSID